MANRRMFSRELTESDKFLEMPSSTQALFFHLGMNADDDGFTSSPKKIMRMSGCREDDIAVLISKRFIIPFESGIVVIVDWDKHNMIRKDRYTPTLHIEEKQSLQLIENQQAQPSGNQVSTKCPPSIVEVSIVKSSIGKDSIGKSKKEIHHKHGEYKHVLLTDNQLAKLKTDFTDWADKIKNLDEYIEMKGTKYKNHNLTIRKWAKNQNGVTPKTANHVMQEDHEGLGW